MSMETNKKTEQQCVQCGVKRKEYVPGDKYDHCPNCGFKEACCNVYNAVFEEE